MSSPDHDSASSAEGDQYIAIWSKAIETQMHFNEMCVRSRQLGLTFVAAALGVGVVLFSRGADFAFPVIDLGFFTFQLHVVVVLVLGALFALISVRELDLGVYHKMLRGAVTFGEDFEKNYMKKIFDLEKGMTETISHYSRYQDAGRDDRNGKNCYTGSVNITAENKIRNFYRNANCFLLGLSFLLFIVTNANLWLEYYGFDTIAQEDKVELPLEGQPERGSSTMRGAAEEQALDAANGQ